jgi:single-strand DNA-binding protein
MAADNSMTIIGNLTEDPELRYTSGGTPVTSFRLAQTTRVREGEGWKDGETNYFRVNVWRDQAEHVSESLAKGARVIVTGRLKTRSWDTPEGDKRTVVEVEADEIGVSLRWANAKVKKATRSGPAKGGQFDEQPPF